MFTIYLVLIIIQNFNLTESSYISENINVKLKVIMKKEIRFKFVCINKFYLKTFIVF
jgi:ABC-type lipoprotein export system ATPase subunit